MAELGELIKLFQRQMDSQREQTEALVAAIAKGLDKPMLAPSIPSFPPFDSTSELWTDYLARFYTFIGANSVPENKTAQVFLTSQSKVTYKLLCNLASQQSPAKDINDLTIDEIIDFMKNQFDPARYIVRERFKFWSEMQRKPGETIHELAARIRQDAVTCDFPSIKDPLDEAMRTRFMCSVNNEAVLKALFKVKDSELTFAKAISTAVETEDAARVAKETVYGAKHTSIQQTPVHKIQATKKMTSPVNLKPGFMFGSQKKDFPKGTCPRCGKTDHASKDCPHMNSICHFCQKLGHIESACLQKRRGSKPVQNTRPNLPSPLTTRGCYRRNRGAESMWITPLIFWEPIGWYWWMRIPNTHVFIPLLQRQLKLRQTCWKRTSPISATRTPSFLTMLQPSRRKNFKHGVGKGVSFTSQVHPITLLQMEQQSVWCRPSKELL